MGSERRVEYAGGKYAPCLRIATHNIRGLGSQLNGLDKARSLLKLWWNDLTLDIVCIQEVLVRASDKEAIRRVEKVLADVARSYGVPEYQLTWGCNQNAATGGVALLVNQELCR
jgi:exonuclease III